MTTSKLKDWLFEKELEDQWWASLDGVTEERAMTLDEIAGMLRGGNIGVCQVLHVSKAGTPNPTWVEVELPQMPQGPILSSQPANPYAPPQHAQAYAAPPRAAEQKNPGVAAVLSFFIPGLGQIYNGQVGMGLLLFVVTFALYFTVILGIALHIYLVYDAYKYAEKVNKGLR